MDSNVRLVIKAVTWQASGLFSMMLIGFLFTGSIAAGGGIALAGAATGFVAYFLHEYVWARIAWGQRLRPSIASDAVPH